MAKLDAEVARISDRGGLANFVRALRADLQANPGQWENRDLTSYLDAVAAWVADMDGYFINRGEEVPDVPDWKLIGQILLAAKYYE